jgi:outer membrane protein assembly factor BamD (BamD/ComL family)
LRDFIARFPESSRLSMAQQRIEVLEAQAAWDKVKGTTDPAALQDFIARFPASARLGEARQRLAGLEAMRRREEEEKAAEVERQKVEQQAWEQLKETSDPAALQDFVERFPSSARVGEAQRRARALERLSAQREEEARANAAEAKRLEQQAWDTVKESNDPRALRDFVGRFPASAHATEAQQRADALEQAAARRRAEEENAAEAKRIEQQAWDRVRDAHDPAALRDFIGRFPGSPHMAEAQRRVQSLEQAIARQREEEQRKAKAAEAERARAEQAWNLVKEAGDVAALRNFIAQFPGLPTWRRRGSARTRSSRPPRSVVPRKRRPRRQGGSSSRPGMR